MLSTIQVVDETRENARRSELGSFDGNAGSLCENPSLARALEGLGNVDPSRLFNLFYSAKASSDVFVRCPKILAKCLERARGTAIQGLLKGHPEAACSCHASHDGWDSCVARGGELEMAETYRVETNSGPTRECLTP